MSNQQLKWDAKLYQDNSSFQFNLALIAIKKLKLKDNERILDIGCGNCNTTIELARHVPNGEIIAIEISADMYEQALKNVKESKISNLKVINQDVFNISFYNEFDVVFANSSIHWINNLETMYYKINRALKNRGRIMVQTFLEENNELINATYKLLELPVFREYLKSRDLPWRVLTKNETIKILEDNNFDNIKVEPYIYKVDFKNLKKLTDFFKSAALIPFLSMMPEEKHDVLINKFLEIYFKTKKSDLLTLKMNRLFVSAERK